MSQNDIQKESEIISEENEATASSKLKYDIDEYEIDSEIESLNDDKNDLILSDIHIENRPIEINLDENNKCLSDLTFILPFQTNYYQNNESNKEALNNDEYDQDGDIIVKRPDKYHLLIEHYLETSLFEVGLQLWKASLYLCDFILSNRSQFESKQVVDLGTGIGLTSLICSLFTDSIMSTDLENVIELAETNFILNKETLDSIRDKLYKNSESKILFKELDWSNYETIYDTQAKAVCSSKIIDEKISKYKLDSDYDTQFIKNSNVFIAADVIYDVELTTKFLNMLFKLMSVEQNQPKYAYIALEKRINFEITTLDSGSSCYDYFEQSMLELNDYCENNVKFKTELINSDIKKYMINYERDEYLIIWKVTSSLLNETIL